MLSSDIPSHLSPQMINSGLMSSGLSGPFTDSSRWEDPLEKAMAAHSSTLAWKIPWTEEPGGLQSMGSQSRTRLSDVSSSFQRFSCCFPASRAGSASDRRTGSTAVVTSLLRFLSSDLTGERMQSHGFTYHFLFDDMNLPFLSESHN